MKGQKPQQRNGRCTKTNKTFENHKFVLHNAAVSPFSPPSNRFDFMNHCSLLKGTYCAFLEPRPPLSLLIYRENSFQYLSAWIFFLLFFSIFFICGEKNNVEITERVWGMCARLRHGGGTLEGDHQKRKLCTAGRKIIVLPQVKNIVAFLKSACKASYIIRMFKY